MKSAEDEDEPIQWMCYWMAFAALYLCESLLFLVGVGAFVPLLNEVHQANTICDLLPVRTVSKDAECLVHSDFCPRFCQMKLLTFLWLQLPQFQALCLLIFEQRVILLNLTSNSQGALYIYYAFLEDSLLSQPQRHMRDN